MVTRLRVQESFFKVNSRNLWGLLKSEIFTATPSAAWSVLCTHSCVLVECCFLLGRKFLIIGKRLLKKNNNKNSSLLVFVSLLCVSPSQVCSKVLWGVVGAAVVIVLITIPAVYYSSKFKLSTFSVSIFSIFTPVYVRVYVCQLQTLLLSAQTALKVFIFFHADL